MMKKPTIQTEDKYVLRLPDGMRDQLKAEAEKNSRSMNAEIVSRLAFSLMAHPQAYLIRALINFQERLLEGKDDVEIPQGMEDDIRRLASNRGLSAQKFLTRLLMEALHHLDTETELGKDLDEYLQQLADGTREI